MSTTLYWRPAPTQKTPLDDELKLALRRMHGEPLGELNLSQADRTELEAFMACGIFKAEELLQAIDRFGEIEVFEE